MRSAPKTCLVVSVALVLAALSGCSRSQSPAPAAQAHTPPPPTTPPPPSPEQLYSDFLDGMSAAQTNRGRVLTFPSDSFAPEHKAEDPADAARLDKISTLLHGAPEARVLIEGFTDDRGTVKADESLSLERAMSMQKALVDRGIDASRLHVRGRGKEAPVADNATKEGRAQNRRIELIFSGPHGQFNLPQDNNWDQK